MSDLLGLNAVAARDALDKTMGAGNAAVGPFEIAFGR